MRIMSFAWTTKALLAGEKTVTRRVWKNCFIKVGDYVQAWDRSPRFGGKKVAVIKIVGIRQEQLKQITDDDVVKEGGLRKNRDEFIELFIEGNPGMTEEDAVWRIEFKVVKEAE